MPSMCKHASSAAEPIRTCMYAIRCPDDPKATPQRDVTVETSTFSATMGSSVGRSKSRALVPLARNRELQVELPGVAVSPFFADGVGGIGRLKPPSRLERFEPVSTTSGAIIAPARRQHTAESTSQQLGPRDSYYEAISATHRRPDLCPVDHLQLPRQPLERVKALAKLVRPAKQTRSSIQAPPSPKAMPSVARDWRRRWRLLNERSGREIGGARGAVVGPASSSWVESCRPGLPALVRAPPGLRSIAGSVSEGEVQGT
ncbi:hypothetical protein BKA56DRAFT_610773 [Ilyonectria sp. MPI-CAGE-AT-0026]|nr:hypothetical protein BKA56DRAFT_610773 [Ilyonectria sp. MPI-CAGE-AT-0026]